MVSYAATPTSEDESDWQNWGPYMSNREWGTVRETDAPEGYNWQRLPYEQARQTAYRYCEDGIFGVCDSACRLCHAYAFWNHLDDHVKERFFGVTNDQGSHGEDVKELYHYRAADPQYRYISAEYTYPQIQYPYRHLVSFENGLKNANDSPVFDVNSAVVSLTNFTNWYQEMKYFKIEFEMCKTSPDQMCFQLTVTNCGDEPARIVVMPMLFLRNTWTTERLIGDAVGANKGIRAQDKYLTVHFTESDGNIVTYRYYYDTGTANPEVLLTHNASKNNRIQPGDRQHCKEAFNRYIVSGDGSGLIGNLSGLLATKVGICYRLKMDPKQQVKLLSFLTLASDESSADVDWCSLATTMEAMRLKNLAESYRKLPTNLLPSEQDILRAAYTTLLWNRQYYPLDKMKCLWQQSCIMDMPTKLVTVPDKWEQPYLATWDSAIHCLVLNCFDRQQALTELLLLLALIRPDGSIFTDEYRPQGVTPPLIVLAAIDVYGKCTPAEKFGLSSRLYSTLKRHLRWWLHRKDSRGVQLIDGGICGVDYVSLFPREFAEIGEGIIWAIFFQMRFIELSLAIYTTPDCPIAAAIEADLPEYTLCLSRLCASFVQTVIQENGLFHPSWLDKTEPDSAADAVGDPAPPPLISNGSNIETISEDWDNGGSRGHRNSRTSDASFISTDGESTVSFTGVLDAGFLTGRGGASSSSEGSDRQRCYWLHAYCYLPVICCCSLPNVRLPRCESADTLEDLLAVSLKGASNWETRAPYVYVDRDHSRLFVTLMNTMQLSDMTEQLLSEIQFLSQYGIRTMSMLHSCDPAVVQLSTLPVTPSGEASRSAKKAQQKGLSLEQKYCSGAPVSGTYGGNTNWYGGVNLPYNYLVIESLHKWSTVLDRKFDLIEYPSYSGRFRRLGDIVNELAAKNVALFLPNSIGVVPSTGEDANRGLLMFETFDGDTGLGHGARHKGGWSAIIVRILMLMHGIEA